MADGFLILSNQRTGTTLLAEILASHPAIWCEGEALLPSAPGTENSFWAYFASRTKDEPALLWPIFERRQRVFSDYRDHLARVTGRSVIGIDIKYDLAHLLDCPRDPFAHPAILAIARLGNWPVLHIRRRNVLAVFLSHLLAQQNERPAPELYKSKFINTSVVMNPKMAVEFIANIERRHAWFAEYMTRHGMAVLELEYESFIEQGAFSASLLDAIAQILGISADFDRKPRTVKVSPPPAAAIANLTELRATLADTPYAWMVDAS